MTDLVKKTITDNYRLKNDAQIAKILGLSSHTVRGYRFQLGFTSQFVREEEKNKKIISHIIELFVSGVPMQNIAKFYKKSNSTISQLITKHYFFKQRSYDTITMVMDSKINYE